jgi:hypothetical protein
MSLSILRLALAFAAVTSLTIPAGSAASAPNSLAAFCKANPNLDFPNRTFFGPKRKHGALPEEVAAVGATDWRCMDGKVYVCAGGAAGSACKKMDPNPEPSSEIRETCEDNPGQSFVAIAVIGNSSSTWRCQGRTPRIIKTVPLDKQGFMKETWAPLFNERGKINTDAELGADPR